MSSTNATPRIVYNGINDRSRGTITPAPITFAQHTPLLRLFTEDGPTETTYVGSQSASFTDMFGAESLNRRGKYFNMQTLLAEQLLGAANGFYVKRLKPEDAGNPARIILGIEIVGDNIPATITSLSGFNYPGLVADLDNPPEELAGLTVPGFVARIVQILDNDDPVGTQPIRPGTLVSSIDGTQSTIFPLMELPAAYFGEAGNRLGFRIWAPNDVSNEVYDADMAALFNTRVYRCQFMRKNTPTSTPVTVRTAVGEEFVDVSFLPGTYSESLNRGYFIEEELTAAYTDDGIQSQLVPVYSPFSEVYTYQENITAIQEMIYNQELINNPTIAATVKAATAIDFLTMTDVTGDRYKSVKLLGPIDGGLLLGSDSVVFAKGGDNGTMTLETYQDLVDLENANFGQLGDEYSNIPLYQFSHLYDTGLRMSSKYVMMNALNKRKDLKCVFTTFVEQDGRVPTTSEEISRAQAIMTRLQAFPEATLFNTGVCRGEIIQQCGYLMDGTYKKPVPQIIDYALKWAAFGGAGTGILVDGKDIDSFPNNLITLLKNINTPFFNATAQAANFGAGATYSLTYDVRSSYYPCVRSVYADPTSVLLSPITTNIACDIVRMITRIHAQFSGNAKLTPEQLAERCNEAIIKETNNRYADRVTIVPSTYFTPTDEAQHFSWHCKVELYANNPMTVMYFDLETLNSRQLNVAA